MTSLLSPTISSTPAPNVDAPDAPAWINRTLPAWTWSMIGVTGALAAWSVLSSTPSLVTQSLVMLGLVAVVGLPHGSFDLHVGRTLLRDRMGRMWGPLFCVGYLAVAAVALAAWIYAPWAGLTTLLILGAAHWGADDLEETASTTAVRGIWLSISRGMIPIATPLVVHPVATAEIFAALLADASVSPGLVQGVGLGAVCLATPGLVTQAVRLLKIGRERFVRSVAEVTVLLVWFAVTPPLLAFAVYFCLWHAVRHSLRSAARLAPDDRSRALGRYLRAVSGPTIATWGLAIVAWWLLQDHQPPTHAIWRLVFIGLFALTIPHVLLEWIADRVHSNRAPDQRRTSGASAPELQPSD